MKAFSLRTVLVGSLLLALAALTFAQGAAQAPAAKAPAPRPFSPRRSTEMGFGPRGQQKKVVVNYGSPAARGRKVFGELVPYDQVWRLGANEATSFTTEVNLVIGGQEVPAGSYTLFVKPGKDKWMLQINKATGMWGIPYKAEYDATILTWVEMKVEATTTPTDRFLATLDRAGAESMLVFEWENTRASVSLAEKK